MKKIPVILSTLALVGGSSAAAWPTAAVGEDGEIETQQMMVAMRASEMTRAAEMASVSEKSEALEITQITETLRAAEELFSGEPIWEVNRTVQFFNFLNIDPSRNYFFYMFFDEDGHNEILSFHMASYDPYKVTEAEADRAAQTLGLAGKEDSWMLGYQPMVMDTPTNNIDDKVTLGRDANLFNNPRGIIYLAVEVRSRDTGEVYWERTKLDYRSCAFDNTNPLHMSRACTAAMTTDGEVFFWPQIDNKIPGYKYQEWPEEWQEILMARLGEIETKIEDWDGDEQVVSGILNELDEVERMKTDAEDADSIVTEVERLRGLLQEKQDAEPEKGSDGSDKEPGGDENDPNKGDSLNKGDKDPDEGDGSNKDGEGSGDGDDKGSGDEDSDKNKGENSGNTSGIVSNGTGQNHGNIQGGLGGLGNGGAQGNAGAQGNVESNINGENSAAMDGVEKSNIDSGNAAVNNIGNNVVAALDNNVATQGAGNAKDNAQVENDEHDGSERDDLAVVDGAQVTNSSNAQDVKVPALSGKRWSIWPLIIGLLVIIGGGWCGISFYRKRH